MPRIYTSQSDPIDFCVDCMPSEEVAEAAYKYMGGGPDGRGNCFDYEADHPPYSDENYTCEECKCSLGDEDD